MQWDNHSRDWKREQILNSNFGNAVKLSLQQYEKISEIRWWDFRTYLQNDTYVQTEIVNELEW